MRHGSEAGIRPKRQARIGGRELAGQCRECGQYQWAGAALHGITTTVIDLIGVAAIVRGWLMVHGSMVSGLCFRHITGLQSHRLQGREYQQYGQQGLHRGEKYRFFGALATVQPCMTMD